MKIKTIGTMRVDGRQVEGVLLVGTIQEVQAAGALWGRQIVLVDRAKLCEGCSAPAVASDSEGVPLCQACWDSLEPAAEAWGNDGDGDGGGA
jgi:hypothetical protein